MASSKPLVDSWHAYRISTALAELVIMGSNFGPIPGTVKLNVQGEGVITTTVKSWSDTAIVVAAPLNATIQRVHLYTLDDRGKNKQSAQSPAGETRNTSGYPVPWAVTHIDDNVDYILVEGTLLDDVVDVVLYDSAAPVKLHDASFLLDGGDLNIDWPAAFVAPITKMRLSDAAGNHVSEVSGGASGLTPDPNGVITGTSVNGSILSIMGSGFGSSEGAVMMSKVGGSLSPMDVISNGWSDSVVQVAVDPGSSYDQIELTRLDGEVSTVDPGVVFPIVVPGGTPIITNVRFVGGKILVDGTGLMGIGSSLDMFITTDETPGRFVMQLGMVDYYTGTTYEFCGVMESKTDTLITFKPMPQVLPAQNLHNMTWLNDVPEFRIEDVHAHVEGVYSGPYEVNYVPQVPVAVSWTPIDQTNYPKVDSATHAGTLVTLHGTNFDDIPRSEAAGIVIYDAVNGAIANLTLYNQPRVISASDTEIVVDLASWSTSNGSGQLDVLSQVDLFTTECDFTEHVLAAPMTFQ